MAGLDHQGVTEVAAFVNARCQAHRNNINRYERLLQTHLTDIERNFIELRLWEEQAALGLLDRVMTSPVRTDQAAH
jgi:hypothetical protein